MREDFDSAKQSKLAIDALRVNTKKYLHKLGIRLIHTIIIHTKLHPYSRHHTYQCSIITEKLTQHNTKNSIAVPLVVTKHNFTMQNQHHTHHKHHQYCYLLDHQQQQ